MWHQLAQKGGGPEEGSQQGGGVGGGGEETHPVCFNLDATKEEKHQPTGGNNKVPVSTSVQERGGGRLQGEVQGS